MPGHGANLIFFNQKKIKIGRPEYSLAPAPLPPYIQYHFIFTLPYPSPLPLQSGRHMCITPKRYHTHLVGKDIDIKYLAQQI